MTNKPASEQSEVMDGEEAVRRVRRALYPPSEIHAFFRGSSAFYPDFDRAIRQRVDAWLRRQARRPQNRGRARSAA